MSEVKVNKISPRTNCGTVTLGDSGDTFSIPAGVTLTNSGTATGFGPTGAVSWNTTAVTSSPLTAASGVGYFIDTSGGAITVNLPAGSAGAIISLADYTNTWQTNNVTVTPNGSEKIGGVAAPAILNIEGQSVTFIYVDATEGWKSVQDSTSNIVGVAFIAATGGTETTCGDYKIHTFTGPGTFTVSSLASCSANNEVSYTVIAGGGGGGAGDFAPSVVARAGGGGGAGGFRENKSAVDTYTASPLNGSTPITVTATTFPITVGGGGAKGVVFGAHASRGSNSVFSTITSTGGGGGETAYSPNSPTFASTGPGGSGGGGSAGGSNSGGNGGSGNTPPVSPSQGSNGGGAGNTGPGIGGSGGGGASAVGVTNPGIVNGFNGGGGVTTSISASPVAYSGGGGGGGSNPGGVGGTGGTGGGGNGASMSPSAAGANGGTNLGGGAGAGAGAGGGNHCGGNGGSGIVIIRYKFQ